ncbi:cation efflux family protein [Oesophagostomum dentatum]|uniref:Cation efflux family protein n=1 Tax=Oesophagostomum dentatum TaxID=61180 RepID=A0A0B1SW01_OESDE|nr:cation efflux family protein [Oesophagostomum dentatum]
MLTFTDAMQLLMRDLLTGNGSEATKAVLLNACAEKRNAQLVCGPDGQGLSLLLDAALDGRDLMVAKIVRSIAYHEGPTQDMFVVSHIPPTTLIVLSKTPSQSAMPRLLDAGIKNSTLPEDENAALGLEFIGTAALIRVADWSNLCASHDLVNWMGERLKSPAGENEPLQLQVVIMCGTMARQIDAARNLVPLLDVFLQLLHTMQEDDEFVVQLLYLFLQLLRHRELANRLMGTESPLGAYVIDLMHDKNPAIREMCDNALVIIGEHSQEWARRIAGERFRWHNAQWLDTVEGGVICDEGAIMDDDYVPGMLFDEQFDDGFDLAMGLSWIWASASHAQVSISGYFIFFFGYFFKGERGLVAAGICVCCTAVLAYCVSASHSLVIMSAMWISIFALCSLLSALYSMTITHKPMEKFSYGLARVPVLAVFSTTVLAQLFSIFLSKESFEHLLAPDHKSSHEHEMETAASWPFFVGAGACSVALLLSAYALKNQPFDHVLTASSSSSLQEHAADICHAICWVIPGLSRLLLPRINSMVLLATVTSFLLVLCEQILHDFPWADPVCCLVLSVAVFSTMWPLSSYTGMILLQTAPPHLLNQIDRYRNCELLIYFSQYCFDYRCISEASTIDGVLEIRSRHFWQLDFAQLVGTVDVRVRRDADEQNVLTLVTDKMSSVVSMLTVQIVKDAAWNMEGMNSVHSSESHLSIHNNEHGHGHGHSHDHDHDDHDHYEEHGHGHSHNGHGHSHSPARNHGHSHDSAPHLDAYGANYVANVNYPVQNPSNTQQSYGSPPAYSAPHGHSHDGVPTIDQFLAHNLFPLIFELVIRESI